MKKQFKEPLQSMMDKAEIENAKAREKALSKKEKIKRHKQVIDNNMPDKFFDWFEECPVSWGLTKSDGNSLTYLFLVPQERLPMGEHYDIDIDAPEGWVENYLHDEGPE